MVSADSWTADRLPSNPPSPLPDKGDRDGQRVEDFTTLGSLAHTLFLPGAGPSNAAGEFAIRCLSHLSAPSSSSGNPNSFNGEESGSRDSLAARAFAMRVASASEITRQQATTTTSRNNAGNEVAIDASASGLSLYLKRTGLRDEADLGLIYELPLVDLQWLFESGMLERRMLELFPECNEESGSDNGEGAENREDASSSAIQNPGVVIRALGTVLMRKDVMSLALSSGILRKSLIKHWTFIIRMMINVGTAAASFACVAELLDTEPEREVEREAIMVVTAEIVKRWNVLCESALRISSRTIRAAAMGCMAIALASHGDLASAQVKAMAAIAFAKFSPHFVSSLSALSPSSVEAASRAVFSFARVYSGGDAPEVVAAACQALLSLWDRADCKSGRNRILEMVSKSTELLAPVPRANAISKCTLLLPALSRREDRLCCLAYLSRAALKLARWNVQSRRKGFRLPEGTTLDLRIFQTGAEDARGSTPHREEILMSLLHAATATQDSLQQQQQQLGSIEEVEWFAVFSQAIEISGGCLLWETTPHAAALQSLWLRFLARSIFALKGLKVKVRDEPDLLSNVNHLRRRLNNVLTNSLDSLADIKNFALSINVLWVCGAHADLKEGGAHMVTNILHRCGQIMIRAARDSDDQSKAESLKNELAAGVVSLGAQPDPAKESQGLTPQERTGIEVAFAVISRLWAVGSTEIRLALAEAAKSDGPIAVLGRSPRIDVAMKDRAWRVSQLCSQQQGGEMKDCAPVDEKASFDDVLPFDCKNPTATASASRLRFTLEANAFDRSVLRSVVDTSANKDGHVSMVSPRQDLTGINDALQIQAEYFTVGKGNEITLDIYVTNTSIAEVSNITLSAQPVGPVKSILGSNNIVNIRTLRPEETQCWRIVLALLSVSAASIVIFATASLEGGGGSLEGGKLSLQSQPCKFPLFCALRKPLIFADTNSFFSIWPSLPARHELFALWAGGESLPQQPGVKVLQNLLLSSISQLPMLHVSSKSSADFGSFHDCFLSETILGDIVALVIFGTVFVTNDGGTQGMMRFMVRSAKETVTDTMATSPNEFLASLVSNDSIRRILVSSSSQEGDGKRCDPDVLNAAAAELENAHERWLDHKVATSGEPGRNVCVGDLYAGVLTNWRAQTL